LPIFSEVNSLQLGYILYNQLLPPHSCVFKLNFFAKSSCIFYFGYFLPFLFNFKQTSFTNLASFVLKIVNKFGNNKKYKYLTVAHLTSFIYAFRRLARMALQNPDLGAVKENLSKLIPPIQLQALGDRKKNKLMDDLIQVRTLHIFLISFRSDRTSLSLQVKADLVSISLIFIIVLAG